MSPIGSPGFLSKPHEARDKLGPVDDPLVGVFVHWVYGPHTTDGVLGKDNPLLLASNFSGQWPGLVGLLNTGACLESLNRRHSRLWTSATDFSADPVFMERLDSMVFDGRDCLRRTGDPLAREHLRRRVGPRAQDRQ